MAHIDFEKSSVVLSDAILGLISSARICRSREGVCRHVSAIMDKLIIAGFFALPEARYSAVNERVAMFLTAVFKVSRTDTPSLLSLHSKVCSAMNMVVFSSFYPQKNANLAMQVVRRSAETCSAMIYFYHIVNTFVFAFSKTSTAKKQDVIKFEEHMFAEVTHTQKPQLWQTEQRIEGAAIFQSSDVLRTTLDLIAFEVLSGRNGCFERLFEATLLDENETLSQILFACSPGHKFKHKNTVQNFCSFFPVKKRHSAVSKVLHAFYKRITSVPKNAPDEQVCYAQRYRLLCLMTGKCMISSAMRELSDICLRDESTTSIDRHYMSLGPFVLNQIVSERDMVGGSIGVFLETVTESVIEIILKSLFVH